MNAQDKAVATRGAAQKKASGKKTARKATAKKAAAPTRAKATAKAAAPKRTTTRNVGKKCSVKGCTNDATRRGYCSSKNRDGSKAAGHYRRWLRESRKAA